MFVAFRFTKAIRNVHMETMELNAKGLDAKGPPEDSSEVMGLCAPERRFHASVQK